MFREPSDSDSTWTHSITSQLQQLWEIVPCNRDKMLPLALYCIFCIFVRRNVFCKSQFGKNHYESLPYTESFLSLNHKIGLCKPKNCVFLHSDLTIDFMMIKTETLFRLMLYICLSAFPELYMQLNLIHAPLTHWVFLEICDSHIQRNFNSTNSRSSVYILYTMYYAFYHSVFCELSRYPEL